MPGSRLYLGNLVSLEYSSGALMGNENHRRGPLVTVRFLISEGRKRSRPPTLSTFPDPSDGRGDGVVQYWDFSPAAPDITGRVEHE